MQNSRSLLPAAGFAIWMKIGVAGLQGTHGFGFEARGLEFAADCFASTARRVWRSLGRRSGVICDNQKQSPGSPCAGCFEILTPLYLETQTMMRLLLDKKHATDPKLSRNGMNPIWGLFFIQPHMLKDLKGTRMQRAFC